MSDVYRVGEDATSEKSLVMTPDTNPQHAYVANYLWWVLYFKPFSYKIKIKK